MSHAGIASTGRSSVVSRERRPGSSAHYVDRVAVSPRRRSRYSMWTWAG
jgi:hypothetical protein